ncbi:MAG TPA: IS200/IS605 family transposase [Bacteroidia bacterium]|jgi:putative transposase|nr:IS200/IS605 family transposase [Bacteroidia bacterium]
MPHVRIWLHAVWRTKNSYPFLTKEVKPIILEHILANAKEKGIYTNVINGHLDHLHGLFGLNAEMNVSKLMQLIKGESAFWINKQKIFKMKFEWADEYFVSSVSESRVYTVRNYIKNQEQHHTKMSFDQEYKRFFEAHGFETSSYNRDDFENKSPEP